MKTKHTTTPLDDLNPVLRYPGPTFGRYGATLDEALDDAVDLLLEMHEEFGLPLENVVSVRRNLKTSTHGTDAEWMASLAVKWIPQGADPGVMVSRMFEAARRRPEWRALGLASGPGHAAQQAQ